MAVKPALVVLRALGLGDLLAGVPALRALAAAFPDHHRVLATPASLAPLAGLSGAVDAVVDAAPLAPLDPALAEPDVAVNLHGSGPESHGLLLALRPRRLLAFAHPDVPATAGAPRWRADEHEVHRWCRLLRETGIAADPTALDLDPPPVPAPAAARGATLLHPGASSGARRWPIVRWATVARAERRAGRRVVVTGGPRESGLARAIAEAAGLDATSVLAGPADVLELAAAVAAAARVVCGDTGVAHLATALRVPSVVLFGPVPPALWGPPADRPWHRALWAGRQGDTHAETPDPGLLEIQAADVVGALATLPPAAPRPDVRPPLPRELQVEVTGACNLRCPMCLVAHRPPLPRTTGSMSFATFRALVDALPGLTKVTLQGLGEPLLAPDLDAMVGYATARGVRVGFTTNGTLLTRSRAERLVAAGLDWLHVSLDAASPATYAGIRPGGDLARVQANVRDLVDVMRRRHAVRPAIMLVCVAMRRNVAELPALVRFAAETGVRRLRVQNLSHSFSDTAPETAYAGLRAFVAREALYDGADPGAAEAVAEARRLADALDVDLRLPATDDEVPPRAPGDVPCDWPWRATYVTHDGTVQPCCMVMGEDRATLGRLGEGGLAAVWRSDAYVAFRAALLSDAPPAVCRGCAMYRGVF
ncbi:MAG TPA: glycosyltransferase family 9 protein [Candidatus Binatia bacterium]|nr:glycosyltransferase family 9 protein [Candidatus Binatia bacterium]